MTTNSKRKDELIKAYLRIKPVPNNEQSFLANVSANSVTVRGQQQYNFDRVFDSKASNNDIFQQIGYPLIKHSLQGYNACVLAYGQTASGKTYTMKGNQGNQGIIPLTLRHLFSTINDKKLVAEIRISYIEIYNENIIDLLNSVENYLQIREDCRKNITILGLNEIKVTKMEQAMNLFEEGESRRKFASNTLNNISSRSHTIFRINIEVVHEDYAKTMSCINMVDLAGSEGVSRTKAQGNTKKEGENINRSILALSNVIRSMSQKQNYVNFRDSKLTRILQSSLCNNSRSIVICTVNPIGLNYQQSINTLKFGIYASEIKLEIKRNINTTNQRYQQSDAKSNIKEDVLLPQQRIEYQQNKRAIAQFRQQNQQLRDYKRILNQKIQFLQLDNHRLLKSVQNLQKVLQIKETKSGSMHSFDIEQKDVYEKRLSQLKGEMEVMADRYQALNEYSSKLQKNQRYLLQRIAKYESQIAILKDTADTKQRDKVKTPVKAKIIVKQKQIKQEICPLTIGSIIILKAQIIELKQNVCRLNQQIAGLVQERNEILTQLEIMRDKQLKQKIENHQQNFLDAQKKQIKNLHTRIMKLKNEVHIGKNRQKKLTKIIKSFSQTWLEQFDEFNEWFAEKKKRIDSIKKQKSGNKSANKSAFKQNQKNQ